MSLILSIYMSINTVNIFKVLEKACGRKTEEILTTKINELMV